MPGGAPPPMSFPSLSFASQPTTGGLGQQMQNLGKSISAARPAIQNFMSPPAQAVAPGAAVPGGQGPIAAGGPQGPAPLPGQQGLPGSPYSPAAGPPPPPPGPQFPLPTPDNRYPQPASPTQAASPVQTMAQNNPLATLDWLKRMTAGGQNIIPPGTPGSAALQGAGMIPATAGGDRLMQGG